ncbi:site-specific integrase [Hydrogenovibrio kuenenii]|uniref:hypothetical protein n=1 Tax=Hydrogenovibrio kuenenii TaxID=63658 RepID=UPI0012FF3AC6|nr:hypothetical protein [Hydrogenovibrio kuenenii]
MVKFDIDIATVYPDFLKSSHSKKRVQETFGKRTSSLKAKHINFKSLAILFDVLTNSKSQYSEFIIHMISASMIWGLRPIEWLDFKWQKDSAGKTVGIRVLNAKNTNDRCHGDTRTIRLSDEALTSFGKSIDVFTHPYKLKKIFNQLKKEATQKFQASGNPVSKNQLTQKQYEEAMATYIRYEADKYLQKARQFLGQLYRTNPQLQKIAKKNRITLYSGRHQFSANAKKSGIGLNELAALMGHRSNQTATQSYGRKLNGRVGFSVVADSADVARVNQFNAHRPAAVGFDFNTKAAPGMKH